MEEIVEVIEETATNLGMLSLLPVAVIFTISIITKRTLLAMFSGVVVGALLVAGNLIAFPETFFGYFYQSMAEEDWQWITLVIVVFGILIGLFEKSGAVVDFGRWLGRFIKTGKQALMGTFLFGLVVFVDDYLSNLTVGGSMKKITDRFKIPRSQLAYIVLLMAGPVSLLIPLSSWTAAYAGIFEAEGLVPEGINAVTAFVHSIPLIFYPWVAVVICLLQIFGVIPKLGMIKHDYARAEKTGNLFPKGTDVIPQADEAVETAADGRKPLPWNFLIPMAVIIVVSFLTELDILTASAAGALTAFLLYLIEKKAKFFDLLTACCDGVMKMGFVLILFVLAYAVKNINNDTGMPGFIIASVEPYMQGAFLPMVVFIVCAIYAFFTGACWDLAMIIMPIVVPLAIAVGVDPVFAAAAVFSGSLFGNVFCPYGDGVILCAQACEVRPIDVMFAIAPYMLIAGGITTVMYLIAGFVLI
ncbi:sodium:proton antiporter [Spirochaetia bacterium]|nr:sodium:proton antiporter [Spirochaetia bacterium]